ncbi:hypothetical protein PYW07_017019 [Mythimna separata]|uniref:Uncharacterized protein n=1 Tax=Mythimna separata TaxID=271217 RepID=A0AAD8DY08_MYTSE|nr:hypothetical protein PYW07_017019 [Mythimna separata]
MVFGREAVSAAADAYVDAWWSSSGSVLFAMCGGLTLHSWRGVPVHDRKNYAQAAAICALANASLLLIDALIAICSAHKDDLDGSIRTKCPKNAPC